jgi:hypothetical protein
VVSAHDCPSAGVPGRHTRWPWSCRIGYGRANLPEALTVLDEQITAALASHG